MDQSLYCPTTERWQTIAPEAAGFDPERLRAAIAYIQTEAATGWPEDLSQSLASGGDNLEPPPWNEVLGPTKLRR